MFFWEAKAIKLSLRLLEDYCLEFLWSLTFNYKSTLHSLWKTD
jgi:hypothetical protein